MSKKNGQHGWLLGLALVSLPFILAAPLLTGVTCVHRHGGDIHLHRTSGVDSRMSHGFELLSEFDHDHQHHHEHDHDHHCHDHHDHGHDHDAPHGGPCDEPCETPCEEGDEILIVVPPIELTRLPAGLALQLPAVECTWLPASPEVAPRLEGEAPPHRKSRHREPPRHGIQALLQSSHALLI